MTFEQICFRYPCLVASLQYLLIGSCHEAVSTIRMYKQCGPDSLGCEACSHRGRTVGEAIKQAFQARHCRQRFAPTQPKAVRARLRNAI